MLFTSLINYFLVNQSFPQRYRSILLKNKSSRTLEGFSLFYLPNSPPSF
jgi:hypothetical protein